ncbi:MAG: hypothetical protein AB7Q37_18480 [Pyrinomonadaceae bacterium]
MSTYVLIRESYPRAGKRHRCIWCGERIEIGERHRHEISRYDGLQDHRWHVECDDDAREALRYDPEFIPYNNERPRIEGAVPLEPDSEGTR